MRIGNDKADRRSENAALYIIYIKLFLLTEVYFYLKKNK